MLSKRGSEKRRPLNTRKREMRSWLHRLKQEDCEMLPLLKLKTRHLLRGLSNRSRSKDLNSLKAVQMLLQLKRKLRKTVRPRASH